MKMKKLLIALLLLPAFTSCLDSEDNFGLIQGTMINFQKNTGDYKTFYPYIFLYVNHTIESFSCNDSYYSSMGLKYITGWENLGLESNMTYSTDTLKYTVNFSAKDTDQNTLAFTLESAGTSMGAFSGEELSFDNSNNVITASWDAVPGASYYILAITTKFNGGIYPIEGRNLFAYKQYTSPQTDLAVTLSSMGLSQLVKDVEYTICLFADKESTTTAPLLRLVSEKTATFTYNGN